jgi:hypothetical protein
MAADRPAPPLTQHHAQQHVTPRLVPRPGIFRHREPPHDHAASHGRTASPGHARRYASSAPHGLTSAHKAGRK